MQLSCRRFPCSACLPDSWPLSFGAEKPRFGGAFGLRGVPPPCEGERGDLGRVLRQGSIDGGDDCVRDGDRCDESPGGGAHCLDYARKSERCHKMGWTYEGGLNPSLRCTRNQELLVPPTRMGLTFSPVGDEKERSQSNFRC